MIYIVMALLSFAGATPSSPTLIIQQVEILDGSGGGKSPPMDVEITGDLITRIGPPRKVNGARRIDGRGRVLIPGLIDAHVHLRSIPGFVFREGMTPAQIKREQTLQLRAYLAAGVTTVLDCAAPESLVREAEMLERSAPGPRILSLAPFITPKGGYFAEPPMRGPLYADLWAPISSAEMIASEFEQAAKLRPFGAKVTMENGWGPVASWPLFDDSMRKKIVEEAAKNHSPLFVHSMTKKEHRLALTLHPYGLVHSGFTEELPDKEITGEILHSNAFVITTVALQKIILFMWHPEISEDPWFKMLVPAEQLRSAADKKIRGRIVGAVATETGPWWAPGFILRMIGPSLFNEHAVEKMNATSRKSIRMLHEAGIPLVMGSDAGNWPLWSTFFHGASSIIEMEALLDAGLSPEAVLVASTSRAAKMLKLEGQVGLVKEGLIADLVLLRKDPILASHPYRDVEFVVKGGVAKRPAEWMADPAP